MTQNYMDFLAYLTKNKAEYEKLEDALKSEDKSRVIEETIALAKVSGFELTPADFEESGELLEDELEQVSGGAVPNCVCFAAGGGKESDFNTPCACIAGGGGEKKDGTTRCVCVIAGMGGTYY